MTVRDWQLRVPTWTMGKSTGTPGGIGMAMNPPRFLVPGDVVRVEIEHIGHIENRVVDEPEE